jgi:hypothetical protein
MTERVLFGIIAGLSLVGIWRFTPLVHSSADLTGFLGSVGVLACVVLFTVGIAGTLDVFSDFDDEWPSDVFSGREP